MAEANISKPYAIGRLSAQFVDAQTELSFLDMRAPTVRKMTVLNLLLAGALFTLGFRLDATVLTEHAALAMSVRGCALFMIAATVLWIRRGQAIKLPMNVALASVTTAYCAIAYVYVLEAGRSHQSVVLSGWMCFCLLVPIGQLRSCLPHAAFLLVATWVFNLAFEPPTAAMISAISTLVPGTILGLLIGNAQHTARRQDYAAWRKNEAQRRALEVRLLEAQRIQSVGGLAAGVAHDLNNYLTPILILADLLAAELTPGSKAAKAAHTMYESGKRAHALVTRLLHAGRKPQVRIEMLDLNDIVEELAALLSSLVGDQVGLAIDLSEDPLPFEGDRTSVEQIVVNLVTNGRDAMPDGGTLTISTLGRPGHVALIVEDTGIGMDDATMRQIFEPLFTTKENGHGLGLASVRNSVQTLSGEIALTSTLQKGTRFEVTLARAAPSAIAH